MGLAHFDSETIESNWAKRSQVGPGSSWARPILTRSQIGPRSQDGSEQGSVGLSDPAALIFIPRYVNSVTLSNFCSLRKKSILLFFLFLLFTIALVLVMLGDSFHLLQY